MTTLDFDISYLQLAVFHGGIATPYNDWTDRHVSQGFSWRPESVSFRTLDDGELSVSVSVRSEYSPGADAIRVIEVPFEVPSSKSVEVGSVMQTELLQLPPGNYALVFETGESSDGAMYARLVFRPVATSVPARVLLADDELSPELPLLMEAHPA